MKNLDKILDKIESQMKAQGTIGVEFQVVGVRCRDCITAAFISTEAELDAFAQSHEGHELVLVAKITAPENLVTDRLSELQFMKDSIQ